ncbi:universal stress protein [Tissierella creatinophila]|uniref:Putative universal stress protein n=1 Tax=Tissierella creatinophila DSM 6911 TaxID=1123403 RepID=A0A1U7M7J7_TISCR|nr:universal stress protein [Tissierella creatinophila]OLS03230.1 putative universal stress protein [Tissierella creatinophila DSM 6911]
MKKVLVTTDGSDNANKALLEAKRMATALDANIDILYVVKYLVKNSYLRIERYTPEAIEDLKKMGQEILDDSLKYFDDFKGEVNTKLKAGDPAEVIIEETEKEDYELVVMGSRGLGTFSRTMLGSVSHKVLNHVDTNVLIVK